MFRKSKEDKGPDYYPALEALIQRENGERFGRRIMFDNSGYDDVLGNLRKQIIEKEQKHRYDRIQKRGYENRLLTEEREKMAEDVQKRD